MRVGENRPTRAVLVAALGDRIGQRLTPDPTSAAPSRRADADRAALVAHLRDVIPRIDGMMLDRLTVALTEEPPIEVVL